MDNDWVKRLAKSNLALRKLKNFHWRRAIIAERRVKELEAELKVKKNLLRMGAHWGD